MKSHLACSVVLACVASTYAAEQPAADLRSVGYRNAQAQQKLTGEAQEVEVALVRLLDELERSDLSAATTQKAIQNGRVLLEQVRAGDLTKAAAFLQQVSTDGSMAGVREALTHQQKAEVKLREASAAIGDSIDGSDLLVQAKMVRTRVLQAKRSAQDRDPSWDWLSGEHEAIGLQTGNLVNRITARASSDQPDAKAQQAILKKAAAVATAQGLTDRAQRCIEVAAKVRVAGDLLSDQQQFADGMGELIAVLQELLPVEQRLQEAKAHIDQLAERQTKLNEQNAAKIAQEAAAIESSQLGDDLAELNQKAAGQMEKAEQAMDQKAKGDAKSGEAALAALKEASKMVAEQLAAVEKAQEQSLADAARTLEQLRQDVANLAAGQQQVPSQPPAVAQQLQDQLQAKANDLQQQAAAYSPEAAAALGDAVEQMENQQAAAATQELQEAERILGELAAAAAAGAQQDAALAALQQQLENAEAMTESVGEQLENGALGQAAGEAMQNSQAMGQMAQQQGQSAAQQAPGAGQEAAAAAAAASAEAAQASQQAGQQAAQGNAPGAEGSNQQAGQTLAAAAAQIGAMRDSLRSSLNLPTSDGPSSNQAAGGGVDAFMSGPGGALGNAGPAGIANSYNQEVFTGADREKIQQLAKIPVPPEYSNLVGAYYRALAGAGQTPAGGSR